MTKEGMRSDEMIKAEGKTAAGSERDTGSEPGDRKHKERMSGTEKAMGAISQEGKMK